MHEFSIVNALLEMCEQNATQNAAEKITKVEVKIGKLSGVEPHLLEMAFNTFKEGTVCDGCEFLMHVQDVILKCHSCGNESIVENNLFECFTCKSSDFTIIDGEEMLLMRLEME